MQFDGEVFSLKHKLLFEIKQEIAYMSRRRSISSMAIVGVGLIGSSVLRAAHKHCPSLNTMAYDEDPDVRARALDLKLAGNILEDVTELRKADLVIICVPSYAVPDVVIEVSRFLNKDAVITDVASVKAPILKTILEVLPCDYPYVPGHPMAGGEKSGPDAGKSNLFEERACFIAPHSETPEWAITVVEEFWCKLGAYTQRITPEAHDQMVALSSHLPHLMAFALMEVLDKELDSVSSPMSFIGGGLREQIRLSMSNAIVWNDIFSLNSKPLLERLGMLEDTLREWKYALTDGLHDGKLSQRLTMAQDAAKKLSIEKM